MTTATPETRPLSDGDTYEFVYAGNEIVGRVACFRGTTVWFSEIMDHTTSLGWHATPHGSRSSAEQILCNAWKDRVERKATAAAKAESADDIAFLETLVDQAEADVAKARADLAAK